MNPLKPNYMIVPTEEASAACMELKRIYCKRDVNYIILLQQQVSLTVTCDYLLFLLFYVPLYESTIMLITIYYCRSQWPRGLRRRSVAARLPRSWVRIPPGAWIFVCCECCVLSGRGLCDELITRPEES